VEGFERDEFGERLAKWVRPAHVQTDTHWMHASIVENGLGPASALWSTRSGADVDGAALLAAIGIDGTPDEQVVAEAVAGIDVAGRTGDARLAGALAAALHTEHRATLMPRLVQPLGMPLARRVADLVGLYPRLHQPHPDEERRAGLVRMSFAADLHVLHAVAAAVTDSEADAAREQVAWSALHAGEAGLFDEPLRALRSGLREELSELEPEAADRCWAQSREGFADARISSVPEAVAATWRWRSGGSPRLLQMVGPSGSGKSVFAERFVHEAGAEAGLISLDDLRAAQGSRADQRDNDEVLATALSRLDEMLAAGGTAVWDATSLNRRQRSLVHAVARRRNALTTHAVVLVAEDDLVRRNKDRDHPVPPEVLQAQLRRFAPPDPGEAHRTWYLGAGGVEDADGSLAGEDEES
jgi:predicted kinase